MPESYLLNPVKRGRKAKRVKGRSRRKNSWRNHAAAHAKAARKGWRKRSRKHSRKSNPHRRARRSHRKSRKSRRRNPSRIVRRYSRRRNPSSGGMGGLLSVPSVIPALSLPLPGMIGKIANGVVQGVLGGTIVFAGYLGSGVVVDLVYTQDAANKDAAAGKFLGAWGRPLLFGALAGVTGGVLAMVAPKGSKGTWAMLGSAGPGLRAAAGVLRNVLPSGQLALAAAGLADYLQVGDLYQAGMGDYLQVGGSDADGSASSGSMSDLYQAGMGADVDAEEYAGV